ncbi:MAG: DEAD/DEAH box helicase [Candidatus Pacebacteria bacterium]|nr:DEAD/DEAH box helicase [Candidatus Paceibacterota bacterium]
MNSNNKSNSGSAPRRSYSPAASGSSSKSPLSSRRSTYSASKPGYSSAPKKAFSFSKPSFKGGSSSRRPSTSGVSTYSGSYGSKPRTTDSSSSASPYAYPKARTGGYGGRPSNGASRFGSGRPSFSKGGRSGGGGRGGFKKDRIDENMFINKATVTQEEKYVATHAFTDFDIHETLSMNLIKKGIMHPSPIQDQSIPVALKGGDIIGIASTGTGKTAAFLIPIINKMVSDRNHKAMVLAPTRELAIQVQEEFKQFTQGMRLFSVAAVGGMPIGKQMRDLEHGAHMIVGTPGRVKDLIARNKIPMERVSTIVLDEADRMLDMGFIDDMKMILKLLPENRQGMFFSATFAPEIKRLCTDFLKDPITVSVKTRDTSSSVDQDVIRVPRSEKLDALHNILIRPEAKKVLIFRETKRNTDELARDLRTRGFKVSALHGDMRSRERNRAVENLAKGLLQIVVATDVAARGIDIPDVTHVINYDTPSTYDTYIHRIGRTGRASKTGTALTFI